MTRAVKNMIACACLIALAACSSSEVSRIQAASKQQLDQVSAADVIVEHDRVVRGDELTGPVKGELDNALAQCATGEVLHDVHVTLTQFDGANAGQAFLIGDSASMTGNVKIVEKATGALIGEYQVEGSLAGGGIIGAAMLSNPIGNLSKSFASAVCEDIFGNPLKS